MSPVRITLVGLLIALGLLASTRDSSARDKKKPPPRSRIGVKPIEPEGFVNTSSWKVTLTTNKSDNIFRVGEEVVVKVTSQKEGYLYLFNVVPGQEPICIFPNPFQKDNQIKADQEVTIPAPGTFRFVAKEPAGKEGLLAYVSRNPSRIEELKTENLTRGRGLKKVSRIALKRLIVVEGLGGKPEDVSGGGAPQSPLDVKKEKDKLQEQSPTQVQGKMREWASAVIEVTIVQGKVPSKEKPDQGKPEQGDKGKPRVRAKGIE